MAAETVILAYAEMDAMLRSFAVDPGSAAATVTWPSGAVELVLPRRRGSYLTALPDAEAAAGCKTAAWVVREPAAVSLVLQFTQPDGLVYGGSSRVSDGGRVVETYVNLSGLRPSRGDDLAWCTAV